MLSVMSARSQERDTQAAVAEIVATLRTGSTVAPRILWVYADAALDPELLRSGLTNVWPGIAMVGGSSCRGGFTDRSGDPVFDRLVVLALGDAGGAAGAALETGEKGHRTAAATATRRALARSGRGYEVPSLVWMCAAPGQEEEALKGIADVVGDRVPVFGGSSADDTVAGTWWQFSDEGIAADGVAVAVLYLDGRVATAFQSGYLPQTATGIVSAAQGRTIRSIDDRPAADVYADWTENAVAPAARPATVLADATWFPFGRQVGTLAGIPFYLLSHPAEITADGGIALFSEVPEGTRLHLMGGTRDSLVSRVRRVAVDALAAAGDRLDAVRGALVIYCGGCMLAVSDDMAKVLDHVRAELPGVPLLGFFSFGEQGQSLSGEALHGNLMISVVLFVDE